MNDNEENIDKLFDEAEAYLANGDYESMKKWIKKAKSTIKNNYENSIEKFKTNFFIEPRTVMLIIDPLTQKITEANKAALEFYGYSHNDLTSKYIYEINVLGKEKTLEEIKKAEKSKQNKFRFIHRTASGELKTVNVYSKLIKINGNERLFSQVYDITELIEQNEKIKKSQLAIDKSPISIIITDKNGNIEYVNPFFEKITGYSSEEVIGKNPKIWKTDYYPDSYYKELWDTVNSGHTWHGEFLNKTKKGELFWESALISPILDSENNITNIIGIKEIVTKEKELVHKLQESEEELKQVIEQKTKLISVIGHDLRNPFNIILGYSQLLQKNIENYPLEKTKTMIDYISQSADTANNLLENLLSWGAIKNQKLLLLKKVYEVDEIFTRVKNNSETLASKKNIELIKNWTNAKVKTDIDIVETILRNLISNSIKFSYENSKIILGTISSEKSITLYVQDFGTGMNKIVIEKIKSQTICESQEGTKNEKGIGIGLQIVFDFAKLINTEIQIESSPNKGTKISFQLPLAQSANHHTNTLTNK